MSYRGRFAPTASGPLHAGSLLCALASWLRARSAGGQWLLRVDDLDKERCRSEFADVIQHQLTAHGLNWDETPRYQSAHIDEYEAAIDQLKVDGHLYRCTCTRAQLAMDSLHGIDGPVYAGTCRHDHSTAMSGHTALRVRVPQGTLQIEDFCQGPLYRSLGEDIGDFIARRSDGQVAYQIATVLDESAQKITEIVRGSDLIGSSFRQLLLRELLHLKQPAHLHIPVLVSSPGRKLSKQNHSAPVRVEHAQSNLLAALDRLGQEPPMDFRTGASIQETLQWALHHWRPERIAAEQELLLAKEA